MRKILGLAILAVFAIFSAYGEEKTTRQEVKEQKSLVLNKTVHLDRDYDGDQVINVSESKYRRINRDESCEERFGLNIVSDAKTGKIKKASFLLKISINKETRVSVNQEFTLPLETAIAEELENIKASVIKSSEPNCSIDLEGFYERFVKEKIQRAI